MRAFFHLVCLALAILAAASPGRADIRVERRTYPGGPGAALKVGCYRGLIEVEASSDGRFHIEVTVDPGTEDPVRSRRLLGNVLVGITPGGSAVDVTVRNPKESGWHFDDGTPQRLSVVCHCLVPPACDLDLATRGGSISIGDLTGRVKARGRHGTLFCRAIRGDIDADNEQGDIVVSRCSGVARLRAMQGNIRAGAFTGKLVAATTNGDIDVQRALGGAVISATAGNITVGLPKDPGGETRIETDGGAITVRLGAEAHCSLRASSVWGKVHLRTMLPVVVKSGGDGRKTLEGVLNGGGPLVLVHASGGSVQIEPFTR
jgi:hypothetical protein